MSVRLKPEVRVRRVRLPANALQASSSWGKKSDSRAQMEERPVLVGSWQLKVGSLISYWIDEGGRTSMVKGYIAVLYED
jgi:hypothetical protein